MGSLNLDLGKFRDIHRGERAFIMANGPSLNKMELSHLDNETVFGANAGFLIYKHYSWRHRYFFCVDSRVVFDRLDDLFQLALDNPDTVLFLPRSVNVLHEDGSSTVRSVEVEIPEKLQNIVFFNMYPIGDLRVGGGFCKNLIRGVTEPFTVVATMIEFAVYMGFSEIYLIGADTNYQIDSTVKQSGSQGPEGVKSLLVSTDDDPNHFDPSYFGAGREWHAPNTSRMVAHYERIKELLPGQVRVWNAGIDSKLDVFARCNFELIFEKRQIDEIKIIANFFDGKSHGLMIDVGACTGDSAVHFLRKGWSVICFEPDAANREVLEKRVAQFENLVRIDRRAVGATDEIGKQFFKSDLSIGISGLLDFHDSHYASGTVDLVSLTTVADEYDIKAVDFLKIDVEGWDLDVLKGFPWTKIHPQVVIAEFEDQKTGSPLGHVWSDIAEFLLAKGYSVYVSEWFPIIGYGQRHSWRRLVKFPCQLMHRKAWGNLIGFREDPGLQRLNDLI